jgi:hypothetical protein
MFVSLNTLDTVSYTMYSHIYNPFTKKSIRSAYFACPVRCFFALDAKTAFEQKNLHFIKISHTAKQKKKALCDSNFKIGKDEDEGIPDLFLATAFLSEL